MEISNSIVVLQPGIYILRHPQGGLPALSISRAPGRPEHNGRLEALWTAGTQGAVLRDGSDCIVMHVQDAPAELLVSAFLARAGDAKPVLRVDKIGLDEATPPVTVPPPAPAALREINIAETGISLIGHIERIGDVVVREGQLLGDPVNNLRLEGFQLAWPDRPQQLDVAYSIALEGLGPMPPVTTGQFCGTRNEARRITEVTLTLVGANASKFVLDGTAYFSGGFNVPVSSGMALSGPSGLEHLTGLSLNTRVAQPGERQQQNPWDQSARTKVFKTKAGSALKA